MAEIYVGSNFPVRTTIFYAGEPYIADGPVSVNIYDVTEDPAITPPINPGTLLTQVQATAMETDPGTYQVVLPITLTSRQREFKLNWLYIVNGQTVTHTSYVDVVTPYADIAEIMQDLNFGLEPSDPNYKSYHDIIMAEKYARKTIDNFCGQSFYLYDDVQVVYGAGTNILSLPFKLAELHEFYADDYLLIDNLATPSVNNWGYETIISESGFGLRVNMQSFTDNTVYVANGMVPPTSDIGYGVFKNGVRYRIQGKFGWQEVPKNVEDATIVLIGDYFSKDNAWRNKYVSKLSAFDWNFEYNTDVFRGTGNLYADQLLQPYVITGMVVI